MSTALFRILIWVAESTFYDDNSYIISPTTVFIKD